MAYSLADLIAKAAANGGQCLSPEYHGALSNHKWKCGSCDLEWEATWSSINNAGSWCPTCRVIEGGRKARKYTIIDLKRFANKKNGRLLSKEYTLTKRKYEWECEKGHSWSAQWEKIRLGRWCPKCGRESARNASLKTLSDVKEAASTFGGECLSTEYEGVYQELQFKCGNGHVFYRQPALIFKSNPSQQVWCPHCKGNNLSENICRAIFESAYGEQFPNKYPGSWLVNSRGNKMQLDGYCSKLNMAFEYHGEQHYKQVGRYPGHNLIQRQIDDETKITLCASHGVTLIVIPFFNLKLLKAGNVVNHISEQCGKHGVDLPEINESHLEDLFQYYSSGKLAELKALAVSRCGKLLSNEYKGMNYPLEWKCLNCEHVWVQTPNPIYYQNTWCPNCAGNSKQSIEDMHDLAKEKGGYCLSTEYISSKSHIHWKCGTCSNDWYATPDNIKAATWCEECAKLKVRNKSKGRFVNLLDSKGALYEGEYKNTRTKVLIKCKNNHSWRTTPGSLLHHGSWCSLCNREEMREAFQKEIEDTVLRQKGTCEGEYQTSNTVFSITCNNNHSWNPTATSLLAGHWCKECKKDEVRREFSNELEELITSKGGRLISEYINARTKVIVECREQHSWEITPDYLRSGGWCRICKAN